jgi:hypothetical protein
MAVLRQPVQIGAAGPVAAAAGVGLAPPGVALGAVHPTGGVRAPGLAQPRLLHSGASGVCMPCASSSSIDLESRPDRVGHANKKQTLSRTDPLTTTTHHQQGKVYSQNRSDATPDNDKAFPLAPLEDLGFMALGEGRWLPLSLEWLETFFIALLGGYMVLLWLSRLFLNLRVGGPKVAIAGRDTPDRPVLVVPVRTLGGAGLVRSR